MTEQPLWLRLVLRIRRAKLERMQRARREQAMPDEPLVDLTHPRILQRCRDVQAQRRMDEVRARNDADRERILSEPQR